jgi:hypothetical protein
MGGLSHDRVPRNERACALTGACGLAMTPAQRAECRQLNLGQAYLSPTPQRLPPRAGQEHEIRQALHPQATRGQSAAWSSGMILA